MGAEDLIVLAEPKGLKAVIYGLRMVVIDPATTLAALRALAPNALMVAVDSTFIASRKHIELLLQQSLEAKERGLEYAKQIGIDLLTRIACRSQITKTLSDVGLRSGRMNVAIIVVGKDIPDIGAELSAMGELDDKIIEISEDKKRLLTTHHKISDVLLNATLAEEDTIAWLASEKAALLIAEGK